MKAIIALLVMAFLALCGCSRTETPVMLQDESMAAASSQVPQEQGDGHGPHGGGSGPGDDSGAVPIGGVSTGGAIAIGAEVSKPEAIMRENCLKLQAAVLEFAAHSGGMYPNDLDQDRSLEGKSVLDYLPGDRVLWNPYENAWAAPVTHTADMPGDVGYIVMDEFHTYNHQGAPLGPAYVITGYGEQSVEVALSNLDLSLVEAVVFSNCRTLQVAIEKWSALNGGYYPSDVDCDEMFGTKTVVDLLPHGHLMQNPVTGYETEPANGCAANPGETGQVPIAGNGCNVGYTISGTAAWYWPVIVYIECYPTHLE